MQSFGVNKVAHEIVTDNTDDIVAAIDKVKAAGADIYFLYRRHER